MFEFKPYSKGILFSLFFLLCACESDLVLTSSTEEKEASFFQSRREKDRDRKEVLNQSQIIYSGGEPCSSDLSCVKICHHIFSLDSDKKDCEQLTAPQVDQFKKLYNFILEQELTSLQKINIFDLKVFLNLSPEPLFRSLKTLGPFSAKYFLNWIASDWQVARVFSEEDWDFLFLEIFLNGIQISPISSLREEVVEGRTFVELAWLKQNDSALFWLNDYFKGVQCAKLNGEEAESCILAQYCLLSPSFQHDVLKEIMSFKSLNLILNKRPGPSYASLKDFCFVFCSSEEGQNYCQ